jgi:PAS domain-containing protein
MAAIGCPASRWRGFLGLRVYAAGGGRTLLYVKHEGAAALAHSGAILLAPSMDAQDLPGPASTTVSEVRLASVLDTAVDGIIIIDEHARMMMFNKACERMFGYGRRRSLAGTSRC